MAIFNNNCYVFFVEVSANLYKVAINFLTSSTSSSHAFTTDEQFVVAQIRKYLLATQSSASVERFDLLYASFQKSVRITIKFTHFYFNLSVF